MIALKIAEQVTVMGHGGIVFRWPLVNRRSYPIFAANSWRSPDRQHTLILAEPYESEARKRWSVDMIKKREVTETPTMPTIEKYHVGLSHSHSQVIDDKLVRAFAEVTGDRNPIHLDDETASKSRFGRRVAHGAILFSIISKVLGTDMPGAGTVYLSQVCNFKLPVFIWRNCDPGSQNRRDSA